MTGFGISITLILLALCGVYCFAVLRWTRGLSIGLQRLMRSFLLALLCPGIAVQEDGVFYGPLLSFLTFGLPSLGPDDFAWIILQVLIVWVVVYGFWMILAGFPKLESENPAKRRRVRLVAIACSFVAWIAIAGLVDYWINVDTEVWPPYWNIDWVTVVFFTSGIICALVSMTLVLFSMSEYRTIPSDILWTLWAACPAVVVMLFGIWYWFQIV